MPVGSVKSAYVLVGESIFSPFVSCDDVLLSQSFFKTGENCNVPSTGMLKTWLRKAHDNTAEGFSGHLGCPASLCTPVTHADAPHSWPCTGNLRETPRKAPMCPRTALWVWSCSPAVHTHVAMAGSRTATGSEPSTGFTSSCSPSALPSTPRSWRFLAKTPHSPH